MRDRGAGIYVWLVYFKVDKPLSRSAPVNLTYSCEYLLKFCRRSDSGIFFEPEYVRDASERLIDLCDRPLFIAARDKFFHLFVRHGPLQHLFLDIQPR